MEGSQKNKEEREGICVTGVSKNLPEGNETTPNWEGVRKKLTLTPGVLLRRGRFFACLFDLRLEKERNLSVNFKKYPFFVDNKNYPYPQLSWIVSQKAQPQW